MTVFSYSDHSHVRRHGPLGYEDYRAYKPWLRDEFAFRCVYCLRRERWEADPRAAFGVDHLIPRVRAPERTCDYDNLVYACTACNSYKREQMLELAPCSDAFGDHIRVGDDGMAVGLTPHGSALIDRLMLNESERVRFRFRTLRSFRLSLRVPIQRPERSWPSSWGIRTTSPIFADYGRPAVI
jgi:hypothetical protein